MRPQETLRPSLLDRLDEATPATGVSADDIYEAVRRDLYNLLNARRPWRPLDKAQSPLGRTLYGYGLPDFTAGAFNTLEQRKALLAEIKIAIEAFEPRLRQVRISLRPEATAGAPLVQLVIDGVIQVGAETMPVHFNTLIDRATTDVIVEADR